MKPFRPGWSLALGATALIATGISAGLWQLDRAAGKRALQAAHEEAVQAAPVTIRGGETEPGLAEYRTATARGRFLPELVVYLDNRIRGGRPGYEVVMPLRVDGSGRHLLVNRGWAAAGADRTRLPQVVTAPGDVEVRGTVHRRERRVLALGGEAPPAGNLWLNLTPEAYARWSRLDVLPFVLAQTNDAGDGLARDWPAPDFGTDKHVSYAWQWFSLSAVAGVFFVILGFRRENPAP